MATANNAPHEEYEEDEGASAVGGAGDIASVEPGVAPSGDDPDARAKTRERDAAQREGTREMTGADGIPPASDGLATDRTTPDDVDPHRWDGPGLQNPGEGSP